MIHAQLVDRPGKRDDIRGLQSLIDRIHDQKLLAGISTHQVSTVELCEKRNYGVDLYMFPVNLAGVVYPGYKGKETVRERVHLIKTVAKPFVVIKALASGRIPPEEGLPFVLEHMKEHDLLDLGIGSVEEAAESLDIVEKYLSRVPASRGLLSH